MNLRPIGEVGGGVNDKTIRIVSGIAADVAWARDGIVDDLVVITLVCDPCLVGDVITLVVCNIVVDRFDIGCRSGCVIGCIDVGKVLPPLTRHPMRRECVHRMSFH